MILPSTDFLKIVHAGLAIFSRSSRDTGMRCGERIVLLTSGPALIFGAQDFFDFAEQILACERLGQIVFLLTGCWPEIAA